jgi:hypothetical protein
MTPIMKQMKVVRGIRIAAARPKAMNETTSRTNEIARSYLIIVLPILDPNIWLSGVKTH